MNIYRHQFVAKCPNDGAYIVYRWELKTDAVVLVEDILITTGNIKTGLQEQIADTLARIFGATQTLIATHQGVEVETTR